MNGESFQNRALQLMEQTNEQLNQMNKKLNELSEDVSQIKIGLDSSDKKDPTHLRSRPNSAERNRNYSMRSDSISKRSDNSSNSAKSRTKRRNLSNRKESHAGYTRMVYYFERSF